MIIEKAVITKFRGFENVEINLGTQLTVIAGQNGTQKTTILGILSQPFTISDSDNPMKDERPLCGGTYKSAFSEKFKLSDEFDKPKHHEWTLHLHDKTSFTIESIKRGEKARFWRKGNREKGSGYIQLPVIFLSLKRLLPIGEDLKLEASPKITLEAKEVSFLQEWHQKILLSLDKIKDANYLESPDKNTLGFGTDLYDWRMNSAGQDNIGKILLAILSFKRLKEKYPAEYKGGILAIDELDATLYPASQMKLFEALRKFASQFKIQIIFTTHSLSILEMASDLIESNKRTPATKDQVRVVFLEKSDDNIRVIQDINFSSIRHKLNVTIHGVEQVKIRTFTEDKECVVFVKGLIKSNASKLKFIDCTFGCSTLIELSSKKVPSFLFPEAIVILDGDVKQDRSLTRKIERMDNYLVLPGDLSPERIIAKFLMELPDRSPVWQTFAENFTKQYCFKDISYDEIFRHREKAKEWFNTHLKFWGNNAYKVIDPWTKENSQIVDEFLNTFRKTYNKFATELGLTEIR